MDEQREAFWEQMAREYERLLDELVALCPWMGAEEVELLRPVFAVHLGLVVGELVNVEGLAEGVCLLAQRAAAAGDRRRQWAFEHWYAWAGASLNGQEYVESEMPEELWLLS
jgi:hypothetical protein